MCEILVSRLAVLFKGSRDLRRKSVTRSVSLGEFISGSFLFPLSLFTMSWGISTDTFLMFFQLKHMRPSNHELSLLNLESKTMRKIIPLIGFFLPSNFLSVMRKAANEFLFYNPMAIAIAQLHHSLCPLCHSCLFCVHFCPIRTSIIASGPPNSKITSSQFLPYFHQK